MFFSGVNSPISTMKDDQWKEDNSSKHNQDVVMPGFRFHPTEEELVEFYLRRKVEGKHFNIELITFVDLYRYDPWELPALAAIGEKEWFFYVPRDRKYRNGDRPNRVTASGYWKATGADRMIRNENSCCIGLKKTLVFYRGKAPKGKRTSWIMNEYRLPQLETERIQKNEMSLCRVYRKAGTEEGRTDSKESHNLSVPMNGNRESSIAATSDSFSTRPCYTYKEVNSSNTNFNFKGVTNELPAALKICESGDCKLLVGERFPAQMEYGVAALQNMQDSGNMWDINRPMVEDIELSLTTCLYSRPPHQLPLPLPVPVPTVEDLYNAPPHVLGVFGNGFTYNSGLPSCSDKLWEWNPVRNNGAPAD